MQDIVETRENLKPKEDRYEQNRRVDQKLLDYLEQKGGCIASPMDLKPELEEVLGVSSAGVLNSLGRTANRGEAYHVLGSIIGDDFYPVIEAGLIKPTEHDA